MPKLTYWVADNEADSKVYSIRGKTRSNVIDKLAALGIGPRGNAAEPTDDYGERFAKPRKITVDYDNPFDLVCQCYSEGGIE